MNTNVQDLAANLKGGWEETLAVSRSTSIHLPCGRRFTFIIMPNITQVPHARASAVPGLLQHFERQRRGVSGAGRRAEVGRRVGQVVSR